MRLFLFRPAAAVLPLALTCPLAAHGHAAPPMPPPAATSSTLPATASSNAQDAVNLSDVRDFARVYQIVRQVYVEKKSNKALMNAAIKGMLTQLDPHSAYLDRKGLRDLNEETSGAYAGLGIVVSPLNGQLRIISPIDGTPAARAGIKPGDVVLKVDGTPVDPDDVDASVAQLRGKPGSHISLTVVHEGSHRPVTLKMTRERITVPSARVRELQPGYAYIRVSQFQENTASELERGLAQLIKKHGAQSGAVLDLRSNPGGLVSAAVGVAGAFLDGGNVVSTRGRSSDSNLTFNATPGDLLNGAPMVVLVNNGTASAAEIVSGALKDHHRALIMGQRTFGKGVVQTVIPVDNDHAVKLTTARYYTPDGTSIQAQGITPDIRLAGNLSVQKSDSQPSLIGSEADLPNHLANENPVPATSSSTSHEDSVAIKDYELGEALNVLKGLALGRRPPAGIKALDH